MSAENPYVNKVETADGTVLMDISSDTVTPSDVLNGVTFHDRSGAPQQGSVITHNVYDGLDSTSTSDALSANQGKALNDAINNIDSLVDYLSITSAISDLLTIPVNSKGRIRIASSISPTGSEEYLDYICIGSTNYRTIYASTANDNCIFICNKNGPNVSYGSWVKMQRVYTSLSQLGLSEGGLLAKAIAAMPDGSELIMQVTASTTFSDALYSGDLYIFKSAANNSRHKSLIFLKSANVSSVDSSDGLHFGFIPYTSNNTGTCIWTSLVQSSKTGFINSSNLSRTFTVNNNTRGIINIIGTSSSYSGQISVYCSGSGNIYAYVLSGCSKISFTKSTNSITFTVNSSELSDNALNLIPVVYMGHIE